MATIGTYLDKRTIKNNTAQIKISVSQHGSTAYIPTGIWINPEQWDNGKIKGTANKHVIQSTIDNMKARAQTAAMTMDVSLHALSASQIKHKIIQVLYPEKQKQEDGIYNRIIMKANNSASKRTCDIYMATAKKMALFDRNAKNRTFEEITKDYLTAFNAFLGGKPNARAIHMRNIRAVFNDAIDNGITSWYPFRTFKIRTEQTQKKALSVETLRQIIRLDNSTADYFALMVYLVGINISDLCTLTTITDGRIEYRRNKTGRLYSVKVEPEAFEIIQRHEGKKYLLDIMDKYANVHTFTVAFNRQLKTLHPGLTSYHARHTWATIAYDIGIPADVISQALGHSFSTGAAVTQIYIRTDGRKVDDANRRVIDYIKKG